MSSEVKKALKEAVSVLYFDDNSDYGAALWKIVRILGGEEATDLLQENEQAAYKKYCEAA